MKTRHKRLAAVLTLVVGVGLAVVLALQAFQENLLFFYSPTQVANGEAPQGYAFRMGGLVLDGSVERAADSLEVKFAITDGAKDIPVVYTGILPDLFREGQGIVARGTIGPDGRFTAEEVLAKHDENYMPPEVAEALVQAQGTLGNPHGPEATP